MRRVFVVVLAAVVAFATAAADVRAGTAIVHVTLGSTGITLSPSSVVAGNVVFTVTNRTRAPRDFEIGGKKTPPIAVGKSATLKAAFAPRPHKYLSVGQGKAAPLTGLLGVFPACTNPTVTTVEVSVALTKMTLSQTSVPCGTVTFVVTNTDTVTVHNFSIALPTLVSGELQGPKIRPGQATTLVINLPYKGQVYYFCNQPEHGEMGESGLLTVQ